MRGTWTALMPGRRGCRVEGSGCLVQGFRSRVSGLARDLDGLDVRATRVPVQMRVGNQQPLAAVPCPTRLGVLGVAQLQQREASRVSLHLDVLAQTLTQQRRQRTATRRACRRHLCYTTPAWLYATPLWLQRRHGARARNAGRTRTASGCGTPRLVPKGIGGNGHASPPMRCIPPMNRVPA